MARPTSATATATIIISDRATIRCLRLVSTLPDSSDMPIVFVAGEVVSLPAAVSAGAVALPAAAVSLALVVSRAAAVSVEADSTAAAADTAVNIAGPSDYLAAERTFLAWIRTGLALMGFGCVFARVGQSGGVRTPRRFGPVIPAAA